ncbi:MAG: LptF/LptG family permease [Bacteroidales bacterium]|nr:LptF/LptG family permease [Bacteroidales bacterium]
MKKLDKFILKSYIGPLILTFSISMFVLLLQFLWQKMERIIGKGLELSVWVKIISYACATIIPMALPLTILLASIMTMGNFGERYELVAMKASGVSLWRVLRPLILLSVVLSVIAFWFSNNIIPVAEENSRVIMYEVSSKKPTLNIRENEFYSDIDGYVIRIGKKDKKGENLSNIIIYDHTKEIGNLNVTMANTGQMYSEDNGNTLVFNLKDGFTIGESVEGENYFKRPFTRLYFKEQLVRIDVSSFAFKETDKDRYKGHYKTMNLMELLNQIGTLRKQNADFNHSFLKSFSNNSIIIPVHKSIRAENIENNKTLYETYKDLPLVKKRLVNNFIKSSISTMQNDIKSCNFKNEDDKATIVLHQIEVHRKFTLSAACLILFFIGAPLGALIRKGGLGMPVVISIIAFILYYLVGMLGEKIVKEGSMGAAIGMWLSSVVFLALGIFLTIKATRESSMLNAEQWQSKWQWCVDKIKEFFTKSK